MDFLEVNFKFSLLKQFESLKFKFPKPIISASSPYLETMKSPGRLLESSLKFVRHVDTKIDGMKICEPRVLSVKLTLDEKDLVFEPWDP